MGFYLGMIHGGVLSPSTGELRFNITTLVTFEHREGARGYKAGREWFFHEARPEEMRYTDSYLIERLCQFVKEAISFEDDTPTWYYAIGCLLGEMSGQLFPETQQERQQWQEESRMVSMQVLYSESSLYVVAKEA